MKLGIFVENYKTETRVAVTPETVKKLIEAKHEILIETNAGVKSNIIDEAYILAGAHITATDVIYSTADVILKVCAPSYEELARIKAGTVIIGMLNPFDTGNINAMAEAGLTAFALEAIPRTTRAQSMDVLSSQANVAGYKAVLLAANTYQRFIPMLMTAAGTIKAARILIIGAGVAGLQAIATAKRLGAIVEASDVRPTVKEQVESLGAKFLVVPFITEEEKKIALSLHSYAKSMPENWINRQIELIHERAKYADIIITTALILGHRAPVLINEKTVKAMKHGSIILDMAVNQGGNCSLSEPNKTCIKHGVHIIGEGNLATLAAADASALYARNILAFLKLITDTHGKLIINREDDIVMATLLCLDGNIFRTKS